MIDVGFSLPVSRERKDALYEFLSQRYMMIALTVLPVFLLFTLILAFPILWAVGASFHDIHAFDPEWTWVGVENYVHYLFADSVFWESLGLSAAFAVVSVTLHVTIGTAVALLLNYTFPYKKFVSAVLFLPFLIPTAILGFGVGYMMNSTFGIVNWTLVDLGILETTRPWFGNPDTALYVVAAVNSWKFYALVTIMVYARLQSIPKEHYETAKIMGANAWERFRDITLPNLRGVLFLVILLDGIWMFFKFDIIWILTGDGPSDSTRISVIYAYQIAFERTALGDAAAISVLLFLIVGAGALTYFYVLEPEEEVRAE
ncbi:ABC-type sugar transport system, permease component [Halalkaliarchaeum sp. AArc-CO]|uniref:carbohydrate ABC transporter permease n=1 Tax=Halalkaliarchaeum sp. AArc-CO TaxID=2866381 RepID=UPI00217F0828|nr:sugar ABC transporter permease [Halalkaliarchaeum sp. AArc-CO]UWG51929.1 ABC-type sugar transport system, permease component [Halalkaliarchaeum sp. AArc-CO]